MDIKIITDPFQLTAYGFSGTAINKDYAGMAFRLMDRMWQIVKEKKINNKGQNVWIYEHGEKVFAGVELSEALEQETGLEQKNISLVKYAYYKHIGPYRLIKQSGQDMIEELKNRGLEIAEPYIEIYGHWSNDESKLETELLMALK
jgi:effector-binding domain-containing protein